jgi:hypothetical protein
MGHRQKKVIEGSAETPYCTYIAGLTKDYVENVFRIKS